MLTLPIMSMMVGLQIIKISQMMLIQEAKDYYELHFASPNEKVLALYVKSLPNPILERKGERWAAQEWISQELFFIGDPLHAEVHRQKFSSIDNLQVRCRRT